MNVLSRNPLSTFLVRGNWSTRRKRTTFGRALTDSFQMNVSRIEPTISDMEDACSDNEVQLDSAAIIITNCLIINLLNFVFGQDSTQLPDNTCKLQHGSWL